MVISDKALKLILSHEGLNQPFKHAGGDSGVTIGYGYDLGYNTLEDFTHIWGPLLDAKIFKELSKAIGVKGLKAKALCNSYRHIKIDRAISYSVLVTHTIPRFKSLCVKAFGSGFLKLPLDAQGALVSLVYNRGTRMVDNNLLLAERREMRSIRDAVKRIELNPCVGQGDLDEIAKHVLDMKRLWENKNLGGLLRRREDEAKLIKESL